MESTERQHYRQSFCARLCDRRNTFCSQHHEPGGDNGCPLQCDTTCISYTMLFSLRVGTRTWMAGSPQRERRAHRRLHFQPRDDAAICWPYSRQECFLLLIGTAWLHVLVWIVILLTTCASTDTGREECKAPAELHAHPAPVAGILALLAIAGSNLGRRLQYTVPFILAFLLVISLIYLRNR